MKSGYGEFEFDLSGALLTQLVAALDALEAVPLSAAAVSAIPDAQGVYQLFYKGDLVYIGKTDLEAGLRRRLGRHLAKVQHRDGLNAEDVAFKAMRVLVFNVVDLETQLIAHFGGTSAVPWNGSGFGANDPGRRRDTTQFGPNHFDVQYPVNIDLPVQIVVNGPTARDVLTALKDQLPYVFRFEQSDELAGVAAGSLGTIGGTAREIIGQVVASLPSGWQATKLPGHVILYKEQREYPQGIVIARS